MKKIYVFTHTTHALNYILTLIKNIYLINFYTIQKGEKDICNLHNTI